MLKMKRGTKVGWLLVAAAVLLSLWVIISQSVAASIGPVGSYVVDGNGVLQSAPSASGEVNDIPNTVTTIGSTAFENSKSAITRVVLPSTVRQIQPAAFRDCTALTNVDVLSSGLTSIPNSAFENCISLNSISIPNTVTNIGNRAFAGCVSLTSLKIGGAVNTIMPDAFAGCTNLSSIEVAAGNPNYVSVDGCLYDVTMTRLIMVPPNKTSISLASTCTTIGQNAFANNSAITSLVVPASVTSIEPAAFAGSGIIDITIPAGTSIAREQGSWAPMTVYGYDGSDASRFAMEKNLYFVVLGVDEQPTINPNPDLIVPVPDNSNQLQPQQPQQQQPQNTTTNNNISINNNAATATTAGGKDPTPQTADGDIDARWFLIVAVLLAGIAVIFYSRMKKLQYVSKKKDSELDS